MEPKFSTQHKNQTDTYKEVSEIFLQNIALKCLHDLKIHPLQLLPLV